MLEKIRVAGVTGLICLAVGFFCGYEFSDGKAQIQRYEAIKSTLETDNANLKKQLVIEHERQASAQRAEEITHKELEALETQFHAAIDELNAFQLQQLTYTSSNGAALPDSSAVADSAPTNKESKCDCKNEREFQKLYEKQMIIARDCDINDAYLRQCIALYNSLLQNK